MPPLDIFPEVEGPLSERSPAELIELIGEKRITGVLEAHQGPRRWELAVRGGEVVTIESTVSAEDPLDELLSLTEGRYRLRPQLLLPDGSVSDRMSVAGKIEDFGASELIRCCEDGGLNGSLRVRRAGELVEVLFDAGTLTAFTLDGRQGLEVNEVWRWTEGEWAIRARPPLEAPPNPKDTGLNFLKELEFAAVEMLDSSAEPGEDDTTIPRRPRRDHSIKVVYLDTPEKVPDDPAPVSSRYARTDITGVVVYPRPVPAVEVVDRGAVAQMPSLGEEDDGEPSSLELALMPKERKELVDEPEGPDEPEVPDELEEAEGDVPWRLIAIAVVLLTAIGLLLWLLSSAPE